MKKFILKLDLHDAKDKRKALKLVSALSGIDLIAMDMKDRKLTVVGTVDPISVVSKLRKFWPTHIESVGPAKEPEKKEEPKKEEGKKEEGKKEENKEEGKKEEGKKEGEEGKKDEGKKDEAKKEEPKKEEEKKAEAAVVPMPMPMPMPMQIPVGMVMQPYSHRSYYPAMNTHYMNNYHGYNFQAHHPSIEENPNACVIC